MASRNATSFYVGNALKLTKNNSNVTKIDGIISVNKIDIAWRMHKHSLT